MAPQVPYSARVLRPNLSGDWQQMQMFGPAGEAVQLLSGLFGASLSFDLHRMPELFRSLTRHPGEGPVFHGGFHAPRDAERQAARRLVLTCLARTPALPCNPSSQPDSGEQRCETRSRR
jgi:hypothetical protein